MKRSAFDRAIENIDAKITALETAREVLVEEHHAYPKPKKPAKPRAVPRELERAAP